MVLYCRAILPLVAVSLMGCSTNNITPDIAEFGDAIETVTKQDNQAAKKSGLPKKVAAARRADLAAAGAVYTTSDPEACAYVQPQLRIAPPRFNEACRLIPRDVNGQVVATIFDPMPVQEAADRVAPTRNEALARKYLALRITEDLELYAAGLIELSDSELPEDIGKSTSKAFGAATGLIDRVRAFAEIDKDPSPKRKEIGNLLSIAAREAAETARYRRLRAIVDYADPFVQKATVQLATLAFQEEKGALEPLAGELQEGLNDFDGGTPAGLARIEQAYANLTKADKSAHFRIYSDIGLGHRAIVESMSPKASIIELARANERIVALAEAVKALAEKEDD